MVIGVLLLPLAVLMWRGALHLTFVFDGFRIPDDVTGVPHWSLWSQAVLVWVWGLSLAAATFAYYRATCGSVRAPIRRALTHERAPAYGATSGELARLGDEGSAAVPQLEILLVVAVTDVSRRGAASGPAGWAAPVYAASARA